MKHDRKSGRLQTEIPDTWFGDFVIVILEIYVGINKYSFLTSESPSFPSFWRSRNFSHLVDDIMHFDLFRRYCSVVSFNEKRKTGGKGYNSTFFAEGNIDVYF